MTCKICSHPNRIEIEHAMLNLSTDFKTVTLDTIASSYQVSTNDLKVHALMHTPLGISEEPNDSISRKIKLKEADMLMNVANEYMVTLKNVGRRINALALADPESLSFERMLSKPMTDLYLGLGGEIRSTVKAIADLNNLINGPEENGSSGLHALANAITSSVKKVTTDD